MSFNKVVTLLYILLHCCYYGRSDSEECHPILECDPTLELSLDKYRYRVATGDWDDTTSRLCPRSDSTVQHWEFAFQDPGTQLLLNGSFCNLGMAFSSNIVCNYEGHSLVFVDLSDIYNTTGVYDIKFSATDGSFGADVPISFAPTGVYANSSTVNYSSSPDQVPLWSIYHQNPIPEIGLYFKGSLIATEFSSVNPDLYRFVPDLTVCHATTPGGEMTAVYTLQLLDPTTASAGEYTVVVGSFSAGITLVLDVPSTASTNVSSSATLSSEIDTLTADPSPTVNPSTSKPPSPTKDSVDVVIVIFAACIIIGSIAVLIIGVSVGVFILRRKNRSRGQNNSGSTEQVDSNNVDGSRSGSRPDVYRPQRVSAFERPENPHPNPPVTININLSTGVTSANGGILPVVVPNGAGVVVNTTTQQQQQNDQEHETPFNDSIRNGGANITGLLQQLVNNTDQLVEGQRDQLELQREGNEAMLTLGNITEEGDNNPPLDSPDNVLGFHSDESNIISDHSIGETFSNANSHGESSSSVNITTCASNNEQIDSSLATGDLSNRDDDNDGDIVERGISTADDITTDHEPTIPTAIPSTPSIHSDSTPTISSTRNIEQLQRTADEGTGQDGVNNLSNPVFERKPEYPRFHTLVGRRIAAKWRLFGVMIGLPVSELDIIAAESGGVDLNDNIIRIMNSWEKTYYRTTPYNWRNVIIILHDLDFNDVADAVVNDLCQASSS